MNELDLIAEARAVRDEGQEPKSSASDFDRALLFIARREQGVAEDFSAALARVVQTDDDAACLIFAADRRRAADAHVGKSHSEQPMSNDNLSKMLSEAERVQKGAPPTVTRDQAEAAMLDLAKAEARPGESVAVSFARLCEDDARMAKLYDLGHAADVAEEREALEKGVSGDPRFDRMLMDLARMRKRSGETVEAAASRLLHEDEVVMAAWASTQGM